MKFVQLLFVLSLILPTVLMSSVLAQVPAFPGAEGGGASAIGGRGGQVFHVTNLSDSGPGSLREACEASGPRIVVFRVAGIIQLRRAINICNPYLTIAGQTAPGSGITLSGTQNMAGDKLIDIRTGAHDVIIQYLRLRHGRSAEGGASSGVFVRDGAHDVIIDHCSISWATDENITMYSISNPIRNVTVSYSIISEGLVGEGQNSHGAGIIVGSVSAADQLENISIHHNLFSHNQFRNPLLKNKTARVINNIVYDWDHFAMYMRAGIKVDIIGNLFKYGPNYGFADWVSRQSIIWESVPGDNGESGVVGDPSIHISGNRDHIQTDPDADNWSMIEQVYYHQPSGHAPNLNFKRQEVFDDGPYPVVTIQHVNQLEDFLLPQVGAYRRLDQHGNWVVNRDEVDQRLIDQFLAGTGILPASEQDVGGFPAVDPGEAYADQDRDGMADAWEADHGMSATDPADGSEDLDGDGYTNLEEFLNGRNHSNVTGAD